MKKIVLTTVLSMATLSIGQAVPPSAQPARAYYPAASTKAALENFDFIDQDLCLVIKVLGKKMGRNVYIDRGVAGTVTIHLKGVTAEQALAAVLKRQPQDLVCKIIQPNTLVVATSEAFKSIYDDEKGVTSPEVVKVLSFLETDYKDVKFLSEPTGVGFYTNAGSQKNNPPLANTEHYQNLPENSFFDPRVNPLSTFSIDVDTASYANVRRFLKGGTLPPQDAVRLEELLNYFVYDYPAPQGSEPVAFDTEVGSCPWAPNHKLLRIGLQGQSVPAQEVPPCNLVFLIDVSGSMNNPMKLPLLKQSLKLLVDQLRPDDKVAIATYAGISGTALPSTTGSQKAKILEAISSLEPGGSTNGAAGIQLAYNLAQEQFNPDGTNRVILCTDGDFNVGVSSSGDLQRLVEDKRKQGVFLSVLGYGMGNLKDATLEMLADKGNGNYAYIDSLFEARKVLVEQAGGTLVPVAKDVKVQVEFNPALVGGYRLLGYENRMLRGRDFNDDKIDAGEMGSGQSVTALYELAPPGEAVAGSSDPLKFQTPTQLQPSNDLAQIKVRYKPVKSDTSQLITRSVLGDSREFGACSENFRFAVSVAAFANDLRHSKLAPEVKMSTILEWARASRGADPQGYRADFLQLVQMASQVQASSTEKQPVSSLKP